MRLDHIEGADRHCQLAEIGLALLADLDVSLKTVLLLTHQQPHHHVR